MDRAALDVANDLSIPCGGWCPKGRKAEDGTIDMCYPLRETPSHNYAQRTEWNVRDADATLILYQQPLEGGTLLTQEYALTKGKPCLAVDLANDDLIALIVDWVSSEKIHILNIAGPRESQRPGIYEKAYATLAQVFTLLNRETF